jgi:cupin fold WbuC family metalloprotein
MKLIYSKIEKDKLLHATFSKGDFKQQRIDISPESEFLQLAALKMEGGKTFRPHKHIINEKTTNIAQESWVVVEGKVKAFLYDLDDKVTETIILNAGDISITYAGGHTYEILEDDTLVYEYKTGPYLGQMYDKVFI